MSVKIAIDGPAGAGKSSIAKKVSKELGFIYVDTGALYRSIAYFSMKNGINNKEKLISTLEKIHLEIVFVDGEQHILLNGEDVSGNIRTTDVSIYASKISAIPEVRSFLFSTQRDIAQKHDCIMDGRDIGTVVLPDADLKIFLTASARRRAERRWLELKEKGEENTIEAVEADIKWRDYNDTHRDISPLQKAEDAVTVDTSDMNFEESAEKIKELIKEKTIQKKED